MSTKPPTSHGWGSLQWLFEFLKNVGTTIPQNRSAMIELLTMTHVLLYITKTTGPITYKGWARNFIKFRWCTSCRNWLSWLPLLKTKRMDPGTFDQGGWNWMAQSSKCLWSDTFDTRESDNSENCDLDLCWLGLGRAMTSAKNLQRVCRYRNISEIIQVYISICICRISIDLVDFWTKGW